MARAELEELYHILVDTRFEFIPRGEIHLRKVYAIVKERYPELCDDAYLCSTNCKSGYNSPEWRHVVRTGLNEMKKRGEPVSTSGLRGVWRFGLAVAPPLSDPGDIVEGRTVLRLHKLKERNPQIVRRKKQAVLASTGCLLCEACDFDFAVSYGKLGEGFAECHHRIPLSALNGDTPTRLADLSVVCANCHRMLHRSRPMISVEELRRLITRQLSGVAQA
jgi:hypothetical protein